MLTFVRGNLFTSPAKVLVNTVNTVGVMGKGIALTFKEIYPEMFRKYQMLCETEQLDVGKLWLFKTEHKWVLNFPTKKHWRNPSKLEFIDEGLAKFAASYAEQGITSVAFPELGCGNGDLEWSDVRPLMIRHLRPLPINIYVYLYDRDSGIPEHQSVESTKAWLRSEPRNLAFDEFWSDLKNVVGPGLRLTPASEGDCTVKVVNYSSEGLLFHIGADTWLRQARDYVRDAINSASHKWRFASARMVYIPEESLLDLWQSVRFHGFCYKRIMPDGLDRLADYLMPILRRLPYMTPVTVSTSPEDREIPAESALQLCPALPSQAVPATDEKQLVAV